MSCLTDYFNDNSSRGDLKRDLGECKVCQDRATGIHYGVPTCCGCKIFFFRNAKKSKLLVCFYDGNCEINTKSRTICRYCRLRQCHRVGMTIPSRDDSSNDRVLQNKDDEVSVYSKSEFGKKLRHMRKDDLNSYFYALGYHLDDFIAKNIIKYLSSFKISEPSTIEIKQAGSANCLRDILNKNKLESLRTTSIIPTTLVSQRYLNTRQEDNIIFITILKDKCYQLYNQYLKLDEKFVENCQVLSKISSNEEKFKYPGWNAPEDLVKKEFTNSIIEYINSLILYAKELPGFGMIGPHDFNLLISERHYIVHGFRIRETLIGDECYLMLSSIQLTRKWMNLLITEKRTNEVFFLQTEFKKLNLNPREVSLIIPILLTSPRGKKYKNMEYLKYLNTQFNYALIYELTISRNSLGKIDEIVKYLEKFENVFADFNS